MGNFRPEETTKEYQGLKKYHDKLVNEKETTIADADAAIDDLVDHEVKLINEKVNNGDLEISFGSWVRGIYYLSLAKFFQPIAYKMAWAAVDKLKNQTATVGNEP